MANPGFGGALDTPRTNIGDATYLRQPDFADISQEASFVSPQKDGNLLQQMRNGRPNGVNLRTPRQQRGPLSNRLNMPASVGGAEFTPLLKSATRNSVRRLGKENAAALLQTPALDRISEDDVTQLSRMDASTYSGSRNRSYLDQTLPQVETSSAASTPMAMPARRGEDKGPLQDGNQLSLREQENVIDRIEKENFGLKLKIHFLQESLRKAGPGFSEAALKENTELKVDKVTMQRELHRYKKHLTAAEKDLESYRQQMLELQEKAKRRHADEHQRAEVERLEQTLQERQTQIDELQSQLDRGQKGSATDQLDKLRDDIGDLEAELREKERALEDRDDELEDLKDKFEDAEERAKESQRKLLQMEQGLTDNEELEDAKDTIQNLEHDVRRLEEELEEANQKAEEALSDKEQSEKALSDEIEDLKDKVDDAEERAKDSQRKLLEVEQGTADNEELEDAKDTIQNLEHDIRRLEEELDEVKEKAEEAFSAKERAEKDLDELQTEMADKSMVTKGLSRQVEEKIARLQQELDTAGIEYAELERLLAEANREIESLRIESTELRKEGLERLQATRDDNAAAEHKLEMATKECHDLREKLDAAQRTSSTPKHSPGQTTETVTRLKWQLTDATSELERVSKEKESLQDQLATINIELHNARSSLTEVTAEREELDQELLRARSNDTDAMHAGQDRLELRTAKIRLDSEVRRLKDENRALTDQRDKAEKTLEEEIEKAAEEEDRLHQEILALQDKLRQSSSSASSDLISARRTMRDMEQRIEDYQAQLAVAQEPATSDGNSELSVVRKDLSAARQREFELLQRESEHRDTVRDLKRQIAELGQDVHNKEASRLRMSPSPTPTSTDSGRKREMAELRRQLFDARQSLEDANARIFEEGQRSSASTEALHQQLSDLEDQKVVLEEILDEAHQRVEEMTIQHDEALRLLRHKLDRAERERDVAVINANNNRSVAPPSQQQQTSKADRHKLRKSQAEIDNLEHDVRQQQELLDALSASESSLRRKLERTRSERAAYRMSAEKLQRDMRRMKTAAVTQKEHQESSLPVLDMKALPPPSTQLIASATDLRNNAAGNERHAKEVRGMVLQMEFMHARWQREAAMRSDAAYAKRFLQLQLDVANACNKAQLRELEHIRTHLLGNRTPLSSIISSSGGSSATIGTTRTSDGRPTLRACLIAVRFVARARMAAKSWAKQESLRKKLAAATEDQRRSKRARQLKVVPA